MNYRQIKEEMNYGLVFRGPGLGYAYTAQWKNPKRIISYEGRLNLAVLMTREILAPSFNVVPVRLDYLFITDPEGKISIGPYAIMEYNYNLYPDLQSGYSFWLTHYSLGCALAGWFRVKESRIDLSAHVTAFGITSRQGQIEDPYFFDLDFGYVMKYLHQDFQFGSWNRYIESELEARWTPKDGTRLAYAYSLQILSYSKQPNLFVLDNTLKFIILPKKHK